MRLHHLTMLSIVVFYSMLNTMPSLAQTVIHIKNSDIKETYSEDVNVSGHVIVGAYITGELDTPDPQNIWVKLGHIDLTGALTIKILSIDGKYQATYTYNKLPVKTSPWVKFEIESSHSQIFKNYNIQTMALSAVITSNDTKFDKSILSFVPAAWGSPKNDDINILVNTQQERVIIKYKHKNETKKVVCNPVAPENMNGVAFNFNCLLKATSEINNGRINISTKGGSGSTTYPVKVW